MVNYGIWRVEFMQSAEICHYSAAFYLGICKITRTFALENKRIPLPVGGEPPQDLTLIKNINNLKLQEL